MEVSPASFVYCGDIEELTGLLSSKTMFASQEFSRNVMKKVLALMGLGYDLTMLTPGVVKLLAHPDLLVKKVACHFVTEHSRSKSEELLLGINTLMTDASDSNPMVRALALKTLCSLQSESFLEYGLKCIHPAMRDRSAYVRRVAVNCCLRIHLVSPTVVVENGLVDELYRALRDSDPIVVSNAIGGLQEILQAEGGIVLSRSLAHHLLNFLPSLTDWGLITVFSTLAKYKPKTEEEMFDIMNVTDSYLKHANLSVCTSCLDFFENLVKDSPELKAEVFIRCRDSLLTALNGRHVETVYGILDFIQARLPGCKEAFSGHLQPFLCRHNEPPYIKVKRLNLLAELASDADIEMVLDELAMHCLDVPEVGSVAVSTLGRVSLVSSSYMSACIVKLKELAESNTNHIFSNIVQVVEDLTCSIHNRTELTPVVKVLTTKHSLIASREGQSAFVRVLGTYRQELNGSVYILEDVVDEWLEEAGTELRRVILTTTLRIFFLYPAACQEILGRVLETCVNDEDKDLSECAEYYYNLLQSDITQAKCVLDVTQ